MDEVALQAMLQQHPSGAAREVSAGGGSKIQESGLQAPSASSGEEDRKARSLEAENKELRARIDALVKKEGGQGRPSIPSGEGGDSDEVWGDCMLEKK